MTPEISKYYIPYFQAMADGKIVEYSNHDCIVWYTWNGEINAFGVAEKITLRIKPDIVTDEELLKLIYDDMKNKEVNVKYGISPNVFKKLRDRFL